MSTLVQFKKLRLIHAIATKKKSGKQAGNDDTCDGASDANDGNDGNVDVAVSAMASPKSEAGARSMTPMELEDGRSLRSQHCNQVKLPNCFK